MKSELTENQEAPFNVGTYSMQAYPQVSEFESMLKEGLTDPAHLRELPLGVHSENRPNIEKLMKNPNLVKDMGERLYETVKDRYDLNIVTKDRAEFYKSIL
jgi:cell division protein YceG involved in septum cleavage